MTPSSVVDQGVRTHHLVALSGGADSTAMALRLREVEPDTAFDFVITPTGDELDEMFAHWRRLGELLGTPLRPISGLTLDRLIRDYNALPNFRQRWCTRRLKIEPFAAEAARLSASGPVISYVGLRADEEDREGGNYARIPGMAMRFPLREWGWDRQRVEAYLESLGVTIPVRTDCGLCFWQRIGQWYDLWQLHPEHYARGEAYEATTGFTFRSPGRDTWPTRLVDLRAEFERGRLPRDRRSLTLVDAAKCRVCTL
jgi:3'-phosphoadenosine 5'-phosphosulfate sulfotransferase (PAPS reductase)/FAD synthetase